MLMRKKEMVEAVDALSHSTQYFRHKSNRHFYRLFYLVCWGSYGENGSKIFKGFKCVCRGLVLIIESFVKILFPSNNTHAPCCCHVIRDACHIQRCTLRLLLTALTHCFWAFRPVKERCAQPKSLLSSFFLIGLIIVDPERNLNVDTSTIKIKLCLHSVIAQTEIKVLIEPQMLSQIYTSTFKVREVSP